MQHQLSPRDMAWRLVAMPPGEGTRIKFSEVLWSSINNFAEQCKTLSQLFEESCKITT
jgi:hypothetical protein